MTWVNKILNRVCEGFVERAYRVRVEGAINQKLTDTISRGLQKSWPYRPTSILVTINSGGGSVIQAKAISDLLKVYSSRYNIPVVTFAEDQCLNSANLILTAGSRCYASPFSMIGDMGIAWNGLWFDRFAKKYDIKQEYIYAPENKVKANRFEPLKPEYQKWLQNYLYEYEHQLKVAITDSRGENFQKRGLDKHAIEEKIFKAGVLDPEDYVKYGLLDGLRSLDQEIKERYSSTVIKEINPPGKGLKRLLRNQVYHMQ